MGEGSSNFSKQRANFAQDGERQSIMEARFHHWIKSKLDFNNCEFILHNSEENKVRIVR